MLETAYDEPGTQGVYLWPTHKAKVFPGAKEDEMMTTIRTTFNGLRQFRNRVFHHEPIWAKSDKSPSPTARYADILQALRWLQSSHSQLLTRLHEPITKLDSEDGLQDARKRLMNGVDHILETAARKKAEKEAERAARKAARKKEIVQPGDGGPELRVSDLPSD
jgi:septal ring factor EnvC (AmiA/AmiB activator)